MILIDFGHESLPLIQEHSVRLKYAMEGYIYKIFEINMMVNKIKLKGFTIQVGDASRYVHDHT